MNSQNEISRKLSLELGLSGPVHEVRGASTLTRPATSGLRALGWLADFWIATALLIFGLDTLQGASRAYAPHGAWLLAPLPLAVIIHLGGRILFSVSPGELFFGLSRKRDGHGKWDWKESPWLREKETSGRRLVGGLLTVSAFLTSAFFINQVFFSHPFWLQAAQIQEQALPPQANEQWSTVSFFYAIGNWPLTYAGHPVFHSFPYEMGPPSRFAGHIVARLDPPEVLLTIEGPKTPRKADGKTYLREDIRSCLRQWIPLGCQKLREAVLARPASEITQALGGALRHWDLQWRVFLNPKLAPNQQTQGIFLSGESATRREVRFIAITPSGNQQMLALSMSGRQAAGGASGSAAQENAAPEDVAMATFEQVIRSLRVADDLLPGRAWINERLRMLDPAVTRGPFHQAQALSLAASLAQAQLLLLSKISVEPSLFDSYYHLGATAYRLFELAQSSPDLLSSMEWAAVSRPLLESAARYAHDVTPSDSRTAELEKMALRASGSPRGNPRSNSRHTLAPSSR